MSSAWISSQNEVLTKLFILEQGEIKAGRLTEPSLGSPSVTRGGSLTPGAFVPASAASEERNQDFSVCLWASCAAALMECVGWDFSALRVLFSALKRRWWNSLNLVHDSVDPMESSRSLGPQRTMTWGREWRGTKGKDMMGTEFGFLMHKAGRQGLFFPSRLHSQQIGSAWPSPASELARSAIY